MISKETKLYSIIYHKCPRCHEGELYTDKAYSKNFIKMHERCNACGLHYQQEPSFFSGAMYVSYALQVALFTTVYVALKVLFDPALEIYMIATVLSAIALFPVTLRLSRAIYLNFFYHYKPNASGNNNSTQEDKKLFVQ